MKPVHFTPIMTEPTTQHKGMSMFIVAAVILSLSAVFITIGLLFFYQERAHSLQQEALAEQENKARELVNGLESYLISAQQLAKTTARLVAPIREDKAAIETIITQVLSSAPKDTIYGVGVWFEPYQFDPDIQYYGPYVHQGEHRDEVVLTYEWTTAEYDFHQHEWYKAGQRGRGKTKFTEPYFDTNLVYMTVAQAFFNPQNEFIGVISVDMVLPLLHSYINEANVHNYETIYVTTAKSAIFVHPLENALLEYIRQQGKTPTSILDVNRQDLVNYQASNNQPEQVHTTLPIKYTDWKLHIATEAHHLFKHVDELFGNISAVILTLWSIMGGIVIALFILNAQAQKARQEKLRLQAELVEQQQAQQILQGLNETLEQKIGERTRELSQAYKEIAQLNQRLTAENQRMSAELEVTQRLQQMVLPRPEELEKIEELDIAGFMQPADEVGGDYYDVLNYGEGIKIGIGDVTGHGLESGVLMLMVQMGVRTLLTENVKSPQNFLSVLNRAIYDNLQRMGSDKNLTLMLLDYHEGTLRICGQHEEVLVVRKGGVLERIDTMDLGFPVGLQEDVSEFVQQIEVHLDSGDGVVLYTDGITEAFNQQKQMYGMENLCNIITQHWDDKTSADIQQAVINDVRAHMSGNKVYDDITLMVIKRV